MLTLNNFESDSLPLTDWCRSTRRVVVRILLCLIFFDTNYGGCASGMCGWNSRWRCRVSLQLFTAHKIPKRVNAMKMSIWNHSWQHGRGQGDRRDYHQIPRLHCRFRSRCADYDLKSGWRIAGAIERRSSRNIEDMSSHFMQQHQADGIRSLDFSHCNG